MDENYNTIRTYQKPPQTFDKKRFEKPEYDAVNNEINRLKMHHNYIGLFNYAMKIDFEGTAKDALKDGLKFYKKNKLEISYNQLRELGIDNGFEELVNNITSTLK